MTNNKEKLQYIKDTFSRIIKDWGIIIVGVIIIAFWGADIIEKISLLFIDLYKTSFVSSSSLDPATTGQIGDTFGGTAGPFIALIASFLTFIAFWVQFRANQEVRHQFKIQQFESQFYEMLRLHKENINEMKITGYDYNMSTTIDGDGKKTITRSQVERYVDNRKVFVSISKELISCYKFCKSYDQENNFKDEDLQRLAFRIIFFGSASSLIASEITDSDFIRNVQQKLKEVRNQHKESLGGKTEYLCENGKIVKLHIKYAPFTGHESRLGHYYRHLYGTVKYVVENEKKGLFKYKTARDYLKIVRSQMSNHEQLMLYYNYRIGFGGDWEKDGFLTKYRMLHNLPIDKVQYVERPRVHFKKFIDSLKSDEDNLFEWGDR